MAADTAISWAHHTMNFWVGCTKVSPACDHCYAEAWAIRAGTPELWQGERRRTKTWGDPPKWERNAPAFFAEHGCRQRVFTNSLADFFDNEVDPEWRRDAWEVIQRCKSLDWLIVTKRVSNIEKMLPWDFGHARNEAQMLYQHCIFIITVVTQAEADRDIPRLIDFKRRYPWVLIGLSMEPLLGRIVLKAEWLAMLSWVIIGGESGGNARPMNAAWAKGLIDQCIAAGVPAHFKQFGEFLTFSSGSMCLIRATSGVGVIGAKIDGVKYGRDDLHRFEDGNYAVRVGKNRTGRLLDGVLHNGFPREIANVSKELMP